MPANLITQQVLLQQKNSTPDSKRIMKDFVLKCKAITGHLNEHFGWIKDTSTKFFKNNQKILYFWRFDLYQRPSSEEAGTRSSSSGSWHDKLESSQESGRTYDWVGSSLRPGSWTFLPDMNCLLDPSGISIRLSVNYRRCRPTDHMILLDCVVC